MAILLDDAAHEAVGRRRARSKSDRLYLRIESVPAHGGHPHILSVSWAPRRLPKRPVEVQHVDGVEIMLGPRVARYARWRDITISAWRLGPIRRLAVVGELYVLLDLERWERMHPGLRPSMAS